MKTNVNDTSIEAYHKLPVASYLNRREAQIMEQFTDETIILTRKQLAFLTDIELSSVCGRVNSLLTKNALSVRGHVKDFKTGNTVEALGLPVPEQSALFDKVA